MKKIISNQFPAGVGLLFLALFQLISFNGNAQYYEEKPDNEIGIGIKVLKGQIIYGPKSFYITDPGSISLQAMGRYHTPLKISSSSPYQHRYIDLVFESGFLFCKTNMFDSISTDPVTNTTIHNKSSHNPTYLPLYAGLCSRSAFSIGTAIFYWKGFGGRDMWGAKFLSLGYNAKNFRISASGEWCAQNKNTRNNLTLYSVDFVWKLIIKD